MADLIRKQTVLNMLDTEQFENQLYTQSERELLARIWFAVNAIQSEQRWIPCSERMPECDYTDVLICVHDKRKGCEKDYYIISAYTSGKHWEPTLAVDMTDFDVVAWMPLPEPYKGENAND